MVFLILANIVIVRICGKSFKFPKESDFTLNASADKTSLKVGDELTVTAVLKNNTSNSYDCTSTASFSKSGLIHIYLYKADEEEGTFVGAIRNVKIDANKEVDEIRNFKIDKPGEYKIVVSSIFNIIDPNKRRSTKKYIIKAENININAE